MLGNLVYMLGIYVGHVYWVHVTTFISAVKYAADDNFLARLQVVPSRFRNGDNFLPLLSSSINCVGVITECSVSRRYPMQLRYTQCITS